MCPCIPPPLVRGEEDTLAGWRGVGGQYFGRRQTQLCTLQSTYVSTSWLKPMQRQQNSLVFITYLFSPHVSSHERTLPWIQFRAAGLLKCNFLNILFMFLILRGVSSNPSLLICIQCSSPTLVCIATLLIVIQFRHTPFRGVTNNLPSDLHILETVLMWRSFFYIVFWNADKLNQCCQKSIWHFISMLKGTV